MDSKTRTFTYTPEYFAVKHYSHYIVPNSEIVAYKPEGADKKPILVVKAPTQEYVIIAGNFKEETQNLTVKLGKRYLTVVLAPHSMNTFALK